MLKPSHVILALALLLAMLADSWGQSQDKPNRQQEQSQPQTSQQPPAKELRGTDQLPLTVKVLPSQKTQAEITEEMKRSDEHAANESGLTTATWVLAAFTLLIVLVGGGQLVLFWVQLRLIRVSADAAKDSAGAAHRAIDETEKRDIILHRAYVSGGGVPARRIVEVYSTATGQTARSTPLSGDFEIHMNNQGMTPAELMEIAIDFCDAAKIPPEPNYSREPFHDWLGPGTQSRPMLWRKIPTDRPASAIYGRIYYRDIFGRYRSSGFIQSILPDGGTAPLLAPPAYTAYD
jgi:hypothetical protein